MSNAWKRKRAPDEVPTPVAVAISDYCRRSKRPASATEVREALCLLSEDEDFRVREVTDRESLIEGLGPFAVVDLVRGTDADLCARRQAVGYYEVVRELVQVQEQPTTAPAPGLRAGEDRPTASSLAASTPAPRPAAPEGTRKPTKPTMQEKIAPKKRVAEDVLRTTEPVPTADTPVAAEPLRSGRGTAPRGRFKQLDPVRRGLDSLSRPESREYLEGLLEQVRHRVELRDALTRDFHAPYGRPITLADVDAALQEHKLSSRILKEERAQLSRLYREHRGASGRVAWALGISTQDLAKLVQAHEGELHLKDLRETFRREALEPGNLAARLDLLGRTKYLADLGVAGKFEKALERDLRALLESVRRPGRTYPELVDAAALEADLPRELLSRALEKLGLAEPPKKPMAEGASDHVG